MDSERFDVIIIGAGPAGATAACLLAGKGYRTLLADRASFPREKVCGDGVGPRGMALLEFMERRWDMKFKDDRAKKDILFLEFMK